MGRERPYGDLSVEELRLQIAAVAGPLRAPFGRTRQVSFAAGQGPALQLAHNASSPRPLYLEVLRTDVGGAAFADYLIGPSDLLEPSGTSIYTFTVGQRHAFLLLPSDSLYMRSATGVAAVFSVSQVTV